MTRLHKRCHDSPLMSVTLHRFVPVTQLAVCAGHVADTNRIRLSAEVILSPRPLAFMIG